LAIAALLGCEQSEVAWSIERGEAVAAGSLAAVVAEIAQGSCDEPGVAVFEAEARRPSVPAQPGVLASGSYAFRAWGTGPTCGVIAYGCTDVPLPRNGAIVTLLDPMMAASRCRGAETCLSGLCELEPDVRDAGPELDAAACAPGCSDGVLVECAGGAPTTSTCPFGCASSGDRCGAMVPSNVPAGAIDPGAPDLVVEDEEVLDTDDCEGPGLSLREGAGGQTLCVLSGGDVTIAGTLRAEGDNPLVILAAGDVTLEGAIDLAARLDEPGAGGAAGGDGGGGGPAGGAAGASGSDGIQNTGGAGGAFCGGGGDGGDSGPNDRAMPVPGPSGPASIEPGELVPLLGGSAGGAGAIPEWGGRGGGGGGALQITALGTVRIGGTIDVSGGGGGGGSWRNMETALGNGGGGGGSGGSMLIEAPSIVMTAGVVRAAGGGGGGSGASALFAGAEGMPGADGRFADLGRAAGGAGGTGSLGAGFAGGAGGGGTTPSGDAGEHATTSGGEGGGGGGGVGCIVLRTATGAPISGGSFNPASVRVLPLRTD
jgi:hypothetical protein